ncbi:hypothetical protein CR513_09249, partial [Mucuna pruriens]
MAKKVTETFKEYAQRWRKVATHVQPPLSDKEMVTMFIEMLQPSFYEKMVGSVSSNFSNLVANAITSNKINNKSKRKEQAIYYLKKKFIDCEMRYSLLERTCCALAWAVEG